jgi:hypothetical protein
MKKKELSLAEKIKIINTLLTQVQTKINELQKIQKDLIRDVELLHKELEVENLYD